MKLLLVLSITSLMSVGQSMTPCGQGVVIRPTNAIVIDKWVSWMNPPGSVMLAPSTNANAPALLQPIDAPSRIIIGESVSSNVPVCVEVGNSTKCMTLGDIRKAAK